jgi:hypothetical protein
MNVRAGTLTVAAVVLVGGASAPAHANESGVSAEAVDTYCDAYGNNCGTIVCIAEADNFRYGLLWAPGTIFAPGVRYLDVHVPAGGPRLRGTTLHFDARGANRSHPNLTTNAHPLIQDSPK